ncbi:MAG: dolichyl-P-Man:Man(7)GlcNAc(2)-PP-dolichol alpha-1,6-mannosyltransferase [Trizodia sp. TS-e1964]|nr:MAG: dolichyl-P-Man:Man(7)GlcNAc(2)-PP-dolichol alpha-1,6-mannosyltransferase [Trizodia sp. TS-e1964]
MPNTRRQSLNILLPLLAFIAIYSFQPHKEWRFVVYAVPGLTSVAAMGANGIWIRRGKALSYRLLTIPLIISCIGTMLASLTMLAISSLNYPGAEALSRLHELAHDSKPVISIHMDTLSCVTGVTRFLEVPTRQSGRSTRWIFDKTEDAETLLSPAFWDRFDYALAERPEKVIGKWEVVDVIKGFSGMEIIRPGRPSLTLFSALERSTQTPVKRLFSWLAKLESQSQKYVTRGWWLGVRMQPKIKILKRLDTHNKTS